MSNVFCIVHRQRERERVKENQARANRNRNKTQKRNTSIPHLNTVFDQIVYFYEQNPHFPCQLSNFIEKNRLFIFYWSLDGMQNSYFACQLSNSIGKIVYLFFLLLLFGVRPSVC